MCTGNFINLKRQLLFDSFIFITISSTKKFITITINMKCDIGKVYISIKMS